MLITASSDGDAFTSLAICLSLSHTPLPFIMLYQSSLLLPPLPSSPKLPPPVPSPAAASPPLPLPPSPRLSMVVRETVRHDTQDHSGMEQWRRAGLYFISFCFLKTTSPPVLDPAVTIQPITAYPDPTELGTGGDGVVDPAAMALCAVVFVLSPSGSIQHHVPNTCLHCWCGRAVFGVQTHHQKHASK